MVEFYFFRETKIYFLREVYICDYCSRKSHDIEQSVQFDQLFAANKERNKMKTPYIIIYLIERSLYFVRRVQRNLKFLLSEKL